MTSGQLKEFPKNGIANNPSEKDGHKILPEAFPVKLKEAKFSASNPDFSNNLKEIGSERALNKKKSSEASQKKSEKLGKN